MKSLTKYLLIVLLIALSCLGGIFWGQKMNIFKTHETESSEVMLEKISKVFKMVAVEGYVSEVYDYKQYKYWDINFLRKKALVRVKAKVSIGYDFEKTVFEVDEERKVITINNFPEAELLSVEHDLDYFDIDEGLFNNFDEKELTKLSAKAKEYAVTLIKKGELFEEAEEQKDMIIDMLDSLFGSTGWKLEVNNKSMRFKG